MGRDEKDKSLDLNLVNSGRFQPLTEGGGISAVSIESSEEALAFVESTLHALLGCEMWNAERVEELSLSTSSSDDSAGVRVIGTVWGPGV